MDRNIDANWYSNFIAQVTRKNFNVTDLPKSWVYAVPSETLFSSQVLQGFGKMWETLLCNIQSSWKP